MTPQNGQAKEISLGDDFGDVAVKVNGVRVEVSSNRSVLAYTNGTVKVSPIANDDSKAAARAAAPKIGDKMPDGTIYAGISPDTNKPMYATPADAPLTMTFNEAAKYAARIDAHGNQDWRVPTKDELNMLFNNRAAVGGFDLAGSTPAGWYWSASKTFEYYAAGQQFSDGYQYVSHQDYHSALRCVR